MVANDNCSACEFQNGLASSRRYDENRLERNRKPLGRRVQHSNGWRGGSEPNLFKHVGLEAREIPAVGEVFSLDFPLYRTSSPPQAARIPTASRFVLPRWLRWVPPTIAATTNFRLHFKCLDNRGFGYILRWLDGEGPYIIGLKTPRLYGPPGKAEPSCGVIRYNRTSMANEKKSSWSSHRRAIWEIAIFGLCSGVLITALMLAENHLLGVAHSSEIYTLLVAVVFAGGGIWQTRSEEHTSELQSLTNLVCRLLLEKKKT